MKTVRLLNGRFHPLTLDQTVAALRQRIHDGNRGHVCTVNVAVLMMMRQHPRLQRFVDHAAIVTADGLPLIWSSRILKEPLPERVTGIDLIEKLCQMASEEGFGIYLLGGRQTMLAMVAARLKKNYPKLIVSGVMDGYFPIEHAETRARAVAKSGAQILLVGMGVPRQEYFIEKYWDQLKVPVAIGVGGSFEVLAGIRRRAPVAMQKIGLEWLFRLLQEPRRLWKRYLGTNTLFLLLMGRELLLRVFYFLRAFATHARHL